MLLGVTSVLHLSLNTIGHCDIDIDLISKVIIHGA